MQPCEKLGDLESEVWAVATADMKVLTWENLEVRGNERQPGNLAGSLDWGERGGEEGGV